MRTVLKIKWGGVICPFFIFFLFVACSSEIREEYLQGEALGTSYNIKYIESAGEGRFTRSHMDSIMLWFNHALSTYQENSLISAFNNNSNAIWKDTAELKFFQSDMAHLLEMIALSMEVYEKTDGAFDPSAAPIFDLWNQAKEQGILADSLAISAALFHTGLEKIVSDPNGFPYKKDSLLQLNFNAIAKGYAVDVVAQFIESKGISNYMVEIGGEMSCAGENYEGNYWTIGITIPDENSAANSLFKTIEIKDQSIATSGNYRNFYKVDDRLIGHTIDPRTGMPVINELKSASILHRYCAVADAYATACMVMGLEASMKLIEADSNLSAYFIYEKEGKLEGLFVE